ILVASASTAVLLVGLFAGALVDRSRRRPLMIGGDAVRAVLLLSIPAAAITGTLGIEQLYVVAFIEAALGSVFDVAYGTYLPSLLAERRLLEGNAKIGMTSAIAEIGGPGLAGALVQLITAPMAILVDAVSYIVSAISIATIRMPERIALHVDGPADLRRQLAEGFAAVAGHPLLSPDGPRIRDRRPFWELLRRPLHDLRAERARAVAVHARRRHLRRWRRLACRELARRTADAPPRLRTDDRADPRRRRVPWDPHAARGRAPARGRGVPVRAAALRRWPGDDRAH